MHIVILPSWYPAYKHDISGSFFREQALALKRDGHNVGVIVLQVRSLRDIKGIFLKPYGYDFQIDEGMQTLRWHTVNFFPFPSMVQKRWINIGLKLFDEYIKKYGRPNIIHVHSLLNAGYVAYEIYKKYGIPYVVTEHSTSYARNLVPDVVIENLKPVVEKAKARLAVSQEFTRLLAEKFQGFNWDYLPNIVNLDFFENLSTVNNSDFTLINICLLTKKKRVDILIRAFAEVLKVIPNLKLKIGGDGAEKYHLKNLTKELNISDSVTFLGLLSRGQVKYEISKASAFVLSSEYETFGVVLIEALAVGKPVIATKCGGPESIVVPEVGYLVEKNSVSDLKSAIIDLYDNYNKFNSVEIQQYCLKHFSEQAVVKRLDEIYQRIILGEQKL